MFKAGVLNLRMIPDPQWIVQYGTIPPSPFTIPPSLDNNRYKIEENNEILKKYLIMRDRVPYPQHLGLIPPRGMDTPG